MTRVPRILAIALLLACPLPACSSDSSASNGPDGSTDQGDTGVATGDDGSGGSIGPGADSGSGGPSGPDGAGGGDGAAKQPDSGGTNADGGAPGDGGGVPGDGGGTVLPDGGVRDVGSCCSAQTTPGCNDPDLEVCVCQNLPSCCTDAWSEACALLVQQKYCQTGVRQCVCGSCTAADAGGWAPQCSTDWNSVCDSVALNKCGAVQGCF